MDAKDAAVELITDANGYVYMPKFMAQWGFSVNSPLAKNPVFRYAWSAFQAEMPNMTEDEAINIITTGPMAQRGRWFHPRLFQLLVEKTNMKKQLEAPTTTLTAPAAANNDADMATVIRFLMEQRQIDAQHRMDLAEQLKFSIEQRSLELAEQRKFEAEQRRLEAEREAARRAQELAEQRKFEAEQRERDRAAQLAMLQIVQGMKIPPPTTVIPPAPAPIPDAAAGLKRTLTATEVVSEPQPVVEERRVMITRKRQKMPDTRPTGPELPTSWVATDYRDSFGHRIWVHSLMSASQVWRMVLERLVLRKGNKINLTCAERYRAEKGRSPQVSGRKYVYTVAELPWVVDTLRPMAF